MILVKNVKKNVYKNYHVVIFVPVNVMIVIKQNTSMVYNSIKGSVIKNVKLISHVIIFVQIVVIMILVVNVKINVIQNVVIVFVRNNVEKYV